MPKIHINEKKWFSDITAHFEQDKFR